MSKISISVRVEIHKYAQMFQKKIRKISEKSLWSIFGDVYLLLSPSKLISFDLLFQDLLVVQIELP